MYDIVKAAAAFIGLVGFRQQYDATFEQLDTDLTQSSSGIYMQDVHPLLSLENIINTMPDKNEIRLQAFNAEATYRYGDVVGYNNTMYVFIGTEPGSAAIADTTKWQKTNFTSYWLRLKMIAAARNVVSGVISRKKVAGAGKTLLENKQLFLGAANYNDRETKQGRFVGYQIKLKDESSVVAIINRIGTQFVLDADAFDLPIYLYHTSSEEPLKIINIAVTKNATLEWHDQTDFIISADELNVDSGGVWFLGYYEDDLPGNAINKINYNFGSGPCASCGNNGMAYSNWQSWFKYASFVPFAIAGARITDRNVLWDWQLNDYYLSQKTFGLNLQFSVKCDITAFIVTQAALFAQALAQQLAVDLMLGIAYNTSNRLNRVQANVSEKALFALDNRDNKTPGMNADLETALNNVNLDLSGINSVCLPCIPTSKIGVRYAAI